MNLCCSFSQPKFYLFTGVALDMGWCTGAMATLGTPPGEGHSHVTRQQDKKHSGTHLCSISPSQSCFSAVCRW